MRKFISVFALPLIFALLMLSGCSNPIAPTPAATDTEQTQATQEPVALPTPEATVTRMQDTTEKKYTVGVTQFAPHPSLDNCRLGFIEGLKQSGFEEGKNLTIQFFDAQGDMSNANAIAQQFVTSNVDLICAIATPSAQAAANATKDTSIPLVFNAVSDPVSAGLVSADGSSSGNITGVSDKMPIQKQLDLIRAILPDAKKIGILYSTSEVNSETQIAEYKELAGPMSFEIVTVGVSTSSEISSAVDTILPKVDCIQNLTDNTIVNALNVVLAKAELAKKPVFGSEVEQVKNGCLASEGVEYFDLGVHCGLQAGRILNGEDASTIPVETIDSSELVISTTVLKNLGLSLPEALAGRAQLVD